tara:strand:+ start:1062 stop:1283 length:222 start_codon:yes stop_codon:yes gene_type:complete
VAEAWLNRRYPAHFDRKLSDSDAEQAETQHWIDTGASCGYLKPETRYELIERWFEIGRMLGAMISKPETWCTK